MIRQNDGSNKVDNRTGGFNSFGIAVPLGKGMALAASLRPYSAVGYDFQQSGKDSAFGDWIQRYSGRGGISASAFTWAWSPIKYVSVGATARYLFGSADRSTKVYFWILALTTQARWSAFWLATGAGVQAVNSFFL